MELDLLPRDALPLAVEPAGVLDELRQPRDGLAVGALRVGEAALVLGVEGGATEGDEAGVFCGVGVHFGWLVGVSFGGEGDGKFMVLSFRRRADSLYFFRSPFLVDSLRDEAANDATLDAEWLLPRQTGNCCSAPKPSLTVLGSSLDGSASLASR